MFAKYKKLVYSQICALLAVISLVFGFMRYQVSGTWNEQMAGSFLLFALLLFAMEVRFLVAWLQERKALRGMEQ